MRNANLHGFLGDHNRSISVQEDDHGGIQKLNDSVGIERDKIDSVED
jgi:hypothetical protein